MWRHIVVQMWRRKTKLMMINMWRRMKIVMKLSRKKRKLMMINVWRRMMTVMKGVEVIASF